jgi:hypothetical protein
MASKIKTLKWGVWLNNFTSRKDDEWKYVWATTYPEAYDKAVQLIKKYPYINRFGVSDVLKIKEFRKLYPITKVDLK